MALYELGGETFLQQNMISLGSSPSVVSFGQQVTRGGGLSEAVVGGPTHLLTDGGNLVQLINPINAGGSSGLVFNYVLDQNGSQFPFYDTVPLVTSNDSYYTLLTNEPEVTSEPETPSHILDHMYAKKQKEPGTESKRKKRNRGRKKEAAIQPASVILPNLAPSPTTKVNIIRKGFATSITNPTTFRPVLSPRPNILQNTKGGVPAVPSSSPKPATTIMPKHKQPSKSPTKKVITAAATTSNATNPNSTSVFLISSGAPAPDEVLKEDCFRQVGSSTDGELCFMLTSSAASEPTKTDTNNETVMMTGVEQEPQETDSLLNEFSICSFSSDEHPLSGGGSTFLLDDKQVYLSYD